MATTPWQAFNEFRARLLLTPAQQVTISSRHSTVVSQLTTAFAMSNMPLLRAPKIGSADRGTIIRPPTDLDILAVFNAAQVWSLYRHDSQRFLYRVKEALARHTRVEVVGARGQAARLFYTSGPQVDVAPVFKASTGGYYLPDGHGGWITTDPDYHRTWSSRRNGELQNQMKPLVRMLKAWNGAHSQRLSSFHLEVMVAAIFRSLGTNSRENSHVFFQNAPRYLHVNDPAGHGGDLAAKLTYTQQQAVLQSFYTANERAGRARTAEASGNYREAIRLWKIIYGDRFSTYG